MTLPTSVGLVLRRAPRQLETESFYSELVGGLEEVLAERGLQVLMQVVDAMPAELGTYRRWAFNRWVRAVVVVDVVPDDPRPALLTELGLPAVIVGEPEAAVTIPSVRTAAYATMQRVVAELAQRGHRRVGRVTGLTALVHTRQRTAAMQDTARALNVSIVLVEGDYSAVSGAIATRALLAAAEPPTAVIYDNDVMALAGLAVAEELAVAVPSQLSIVAWDDSQLCRLATPPLAVMSHDVHAQGMLAARSLVEVLDGHDPGNVDTPDPVFVPRGSVTPLSRVTSPG